MSIYVWCGCASVVPGKRVVGKVGQRWVGFSLGSLGSVWFVVCRCWVYIVVVCLALFPARTKGDSAGLQ